MDRHQRTAGERADRREACSPGWRRSINSCPSNLLRDPTDANLAQRIAIGNFLLFVFNLLPAYPMDGGRVLRSLLMLFKPEEEATRIAAGAGQALAAMLGLFGLLYSNFMVVFVAMFIYIGASQEGAAVRGRLLTTGVPVRAAMITDFRTLVARGEHPGRREICCWPPRSTIFR